MSDAQTIGYKGLVALVKEARGIQGFFAGRDARRIGAPPYQLILLHQIDLRARGRRVGERSEWHTVTSGDLPDAPPETFLHASWGEKDVLRILIGHEIERAARHGERPRIDVRPAFWGSGDTRLATYTVPAGDDTREFGGPCHTVSIGDGYMTLAGDVAMPAGRYSTASWSTPAGTDRHDPKYGYFHYRFDPTLDERARLERRRTAAAAADDPSAA